MHNHEVADGSVEGALEPGWLRALAPFVASRAEAAERERRPDDDVMAALRRAGLYYVVARAAIRARLTHTTTTCGDAVRRMLDTAGSSAHNLSNPLQRVARDVAMAIAHVAHDPLTTAELYGRTLLGLPPQTPIV